MFSDVGALGLSLLALRWTTKPHTSQKTYGYHRLEILVALLNGVVLWAMAAYIFYEAYGRVFHPPQINTVPMIIVASLGLAVNLFGVYILYPSKESNINLRSAFLHLLADSLGSLAAIGAGVAILFKGWYWFDPLAGGVVAVMIILGSWQLLREASEILMEATPKHIDLDEVSRALEAHPLVDEVHDLHIWTLSSGINVLSVHVNISNSEDRDCLTWELEELLRHRFGLEHNTIQIEGPGFHDPRVCPLTRLNGLNNGNHR
jgi:cobalt-zinc-cadmium efflux system protein